MVCWYGIGTMQRCTKSVCSIRSSVYFAEVTEMKYREWNAARGRFER